GGCGRLQALDLAGTSVSSADLVRSRQLKGLTDTVPHPDAGWRPRPGWLDVTPGPGRGVAGLHPDRRHRPGAAQDLAAAPGAPPEARRSVRAVSLPLPPLRRALTTTPDTFPPFSAPARRGFRIRSLRGP